MASVLSSFTDPPYWIRTDRAASASLLLATTSRIHWQADWASSGVAAFPVPMAQRGS